MFEIEIECTNQKIQLNELLNEVQSILSVVQDSEIPISKKESNSIMKSYQDLLSLKHMTHLDSRNGITVEAQHIVKFIPNKYAVTDKADGERHFMFVVSSGVYLLTMNLTVKKINMEITDKKYHNMILDVN